MPNGKDVDKFFSKKKFLTPSSMAIRFCYIESVHNKALRL